MANESIIKLTKHNMVSAISLYHHLHRYNQTFTFDQWLSQYVIIQGHIPEIHFIHDFTKSDYLLTLDLAIEIVQNYQDDELKNYLYRKREEVYREMRKKMESINNRNFNRKDESDEQHRQDTN